MNTGPDTAPDAPTPAGSPTPSSTPSANPSTAPSTTPSTDTAPVLTTGEKDAAPGVGENSRGKIVGTVLDAAIDTELETGEREPDRKTAQAHIVVRAARGMAGVCIIAVGVALTVLPGPGVLLILAGLGVLAIDYPFAARLKDRLLPTGGQYAGRAGRILKRTLLGLGVLVTALLLLVVLGVVLGTILVINALG